MMMVISPAKTLDFERKLPVKEYTQSVFREDSAMLVDELRKLSPAALSSLMNISPKLAELNYGRYSAWQAPLTPKTGRQAIYAYNGDVYEGLDAYSLDKRDINFAQKQLRILSGLHGLLRPLDLIRPYRLDMGTALANYRGKDLYAFWGNKLAQQFKEQMQESGSKLLVNLASHEYFKAIESGMKGIRIITPVFKDMHHGEFVIKSLYAKKARGWMSRFMIRHRITKPQHIKAFSEGGYLFSSSLSDGDNWVFTRG